MSLAASEPKSSGGAGIRTRDPLNRKPALFLRNAATGARTCPINRLQGIASFLAIRSTARGRRPGPQAASPRAAQHRSESQRRAPELSDWHGREAEWTAGDAGAVEGAHEDRGVETRGLGETPGGLSA